jgi:hypothetical protein
VSEGSPAGVSGLTGEISPREPRLRTERLCLRVPASKDAEGLYELLADAEVMRGLGEDPVSSVEEVGVLIEEMIGGRGTDGLDDEAPGISTTGGRRVAPCRW